ncbi:unannotated protein [freshwater metagenome]|uniref:Unannotated protein n=1 Tax=freshwater metagenome TaxID=449393 RepID=A0A6J6C8P2_9ZZZZ
MDGLDEVNKNNQAAKVSSSGLVVVAWLLALLQVLLDLGSRFAQFSAVPALAALQVSLALELAILAALVLRRVEEPRNQGGTRRPVWPLLVALLGTSLAILGRVSISALEPTVAWLAPVLLVAPAALTWEVTRMYRAGSRLSSVVCLRVAATWSVVGAFCLIALTLSPTRWNQIDVRTTGLNWVGWSLGVVASCAVFLSLVKRSRGVAIRFLLVAASASAVLLSGRSATELPAASQTPVLFPLLGATVILVAMLTPSRAVARLTYLLRTSAKAVRTSAGRILQELLDVLRKATSTSGRAWGNVIRFASFGEVPVQQRMTRQHLVGAATMGVLSVGFIAHGVWWADRAGWQPTGHAATLMMRASQVGTVDHPLLGLVTSLGSIGKGSHLGPLPMDLLAPFIRLFGVRTGALLAASAFTLLCWAVSVWSAWRAAGATVALAAWVMAPVVIAVPALGAFWEGNNISISLLAITATLLASWAAASGTPRAWWWAVGLGSFCAQSYIPHALIIIGPVVFSGLALAGSRRAATEPDQQHDLQKVIKVGWLIAAVAWFQPALDAVLHQGGNIRELILEVTNPQPNVGISGFPRAIAWVFAVPPRWGEITKSFAQAGNAEEFIRGSLVAGLLIALLLGYLWWRSRSAMVQNERQLRIVTLLVLLGTGLNVTQLPQDFLRSFQLGWLVVVSIFVWFSIFASLFLATRERLVALISLRWVQALRAGVFSVSALAVIALGMSGPERIEDVKDRAFTIDALIDPLVEQTLSEFDSSEAVLVPQAGGRLNEIATDTLLSNLIVGGLNARVETSPSGMNYGERRMVTQWSGPALWITSALSPIKPDGKLLASVSEPNWNQKRFDQLAQQVATTVRAAPEAKLYPWVDRYLVRYLSGWIPDEDLCSTAEQIRSGTYPLASLPPALLLTLYADLAFSAPRLDQSIQDEVSGVIGQGPLEVWLTEIEQPVDIAGTNLLRNGKACPQSVGPS